MSDTTYRIIEMPDGSFGVETTEAEREPRIVATRPTKSDAEAYIANQKMMDAAAEKFERNMPRNWRDS